MNAGKKLHNTNKKPMNRKTALNSAETLRKIAQAIKNAKERFLETGRLETNISYNNGKMGSVPSVSYPPIFTCSGICSGTCGPDCYGLAMIIRTGAENGTRIKSWSRNLIAYRENPEYHFSVISSAQKINKFFRYFVSGDIIDAKYFEYMVKTSLENPGCTSLVFTKQYKIVNEWIKQNGSLPDNLQIIFSGGWGIQIPNPFNLPTSYCYGSDEEKSDEWLTCPDDCSMCAANGTGCFFMKSGECVGFAKH